MNVHIERISLDGGSLVNAGTNDLFVDIIAGQWAGGQGSFAATIKLKQRHRDDWKTLGDLLVADTLAAGSTAGICIDGLIDAEQYIGWLRALQDERHALLCEARWQRELREQGAIVDNLTLCLMHRRPAESSWLRGIWTETDNLKFDEDADLMLAAFDVPLLDEPPWPQPLSLPAFASVLGGATQWLCPLEAPIGFVVGAHGWHQFRNLWEERASADMHVRFT